MMKSSLHSRTCHKRKRKLQTLIQRIPDQHTVHRNLDALHSRPNISMTYYAWYRTHHVQSSSPAHGRHSNWHIKRHQMFRKTFWHRTECVLVKRHSESGSVCCGLVGYVQPLSWTCCVIHSTLPLFTPLPYPAPPVDDEDEDQQND